MKRFKFNLEALYKIRQQEEEDEKRRFLETIKPYNELQAQRNRIKERLIRNMNTQTTDLSAKDMASNTMIAQIQYIDSQLAAMQPEIDEARNRYNEARRKTRVIEILREKQWKAYLEEVQREEMEEVEEIIMNMNWRKNHEK